MYVLYKKTGCKHCELASKYIEENNNFDFRYINTIFL